MRLPVQVAVEVTVAVDSVGAASAAEAAVLAGEVFPSVEAVAVVAPGASL